MDSHLKNA
ncbi:hypothetical protein Pint_22435 [Pistacia integerrima]|uniref:Uncharacterized protein n=1 Tax=Pistacia integerrima TaxID=434235 RepID=A0ACC0YNX3_9ROSI|nr:hypothetical protein Pint_22435 [Pistacia integerrima]